MIEAGHRSLAGWENVGSSAAALIGLQFAMIALINDTRIRTNPGTISAFGTPTVVHLGGALLVSAVMSAPWPTLFASSFAVTACCGLVRLGYCATVWFTRSGRRLN